MSAMKAVLDELHALWAKAEAAGDTVAEDVKALYHRLAGDLPQLEHEAETDAADVVKTAATEGVLPAEQEAVKDGGELAGEVAADVATAVQDAARTPQQTTAVIAAETAVADSGQHSA